MEVPSRGAPGRPSDSLPRTCHCCGLLQRVPHAPPGMLACCRRCGARLRWSGRNATAASRTAAIAAAALVLYPVAVMLPMIRVQQLGHVSQTSIVQGVASLFAAGQFLVALIVLLCSIMFPLGKLVALLALSAGGLNLGSRPKALTFELIELTGRWGMLDVLLVAVLVAALKLGNVMEVTPGPAALAFAACVTLSLLATISFDPHRLWEPA